MESVLTFLDDNLCKFHVPYACTGGACALETRRRFVTERGKKKKTRNLNPGLTAWVKRKETKKVVIMLLCCEQSISMYVDGVILTRNSNTLCNDTLFICSFVLLLLCLLTSRGISQNTERRMYSLLAVYFTHVCLRLAVICGKRLSASKLNGILKTPGVKRRLY